MISPYAIEVKQLTHSYFTKKAEMIAIRSITFSVLPGEFLVIVGPSGCGKSTILSLIAGIFPYTSGEILLFGQEVRGPSDKIGYMLQKDGLLDWRTVEGNIHLGLEIQRKNTSADLSYAKDLLRQVGLAQTLKYYPSQLSGGMRQRVALVRTLATKPEILLLDEPFSALDIQHKLHLEELLVRLLTQQKKTAILVTHDLEEAIALGDRIMVMGGQPGEIRQIFDVPETLRNLSPMKTRGHPDFRPLFEKLWREVERP
ncbi:ABC transporter ATP-binding protein [Thermoflavimicrobium dichotomicum]|uniref:NitT/TauT family transport system ATP-binding protein n=1 Tax=Thermoflavimicrobium dichotomicum TaxID=46223 RepID=A0A1I3R7D3_9BACL|nr:ABC transporter ATP-binding protein [Thermoflavimicrobium dichotomicum]SFJ42544.1 NitT/TauT family transport system ATP-binding protein [Thermoflavimicrobium dichotomicum]